MRNFRSSFRGFLTSSIKTTKLREVVNYNVSHVYHVVSDVESYSQFVPWCESSTIIEVISPKQILADLTVGFYGISSETFRSLVTFEPNRSVTAVASNDVYSKSPLKSLKNVWNFEDFGNNKTCVSISLEFDFHNPIYTQLSSYFLERVSNLAIKAFIKRCGEVNPPLGENPVNIRNNYDFESFRSLASCTHFREYEIEILAAAFSKYQFNGKLTKEGFHKWLEGPTDRSNILFKAMDKDDNNFLSFREFINGASLIDRGTGDEKRLMWFRLRPDEEITQPEVELVIMATLSFREALRRQLLEHYKTIDIEMEAVRLVAPVFRGGQINKQAFSRLLATI